ARNSRASNRPGWCSWCWACWRWACSSEAAARPRPTPWGARRREIGGIHRSPPMAQENERGDAPRRQPYTLLAAQGRVYARNTAQKVIDLGALARRDGGAFCYLLDGNKETGEGFSTEAEALRDIARH